MFDEGDDDESVLQIFADIIHAQLRLLQRIVRPMSQHLAIQTMINEK
jgi:hypothetical protein